MRHVKTRNVNVEEERAMMGYGWGMGVGWIFMLVFWVVLIGLIVWAVTRLLPSSGTRDGGDRAEVPEEILDRRFASGEIDAEEYQRVRDQLAATRAGRR
jgi:putative membrane protein